MRTYHPLGIPTIVRRDSEMYLLRCKMYVSGDESSLSRIEWMRFEEGSTLSELVRSILHAAFEVDELEADLEGKEVLIEPNSLSDGICVPFIVDDCAPRGIH